MELDLQDLRIASPYSAPEVPCWDIRPIRKVTNALTDDWDYNTEIPADDNLENQSYPCHFKISFAIPEGTPCHTMYMPSRPSGSIASDMDQCNSGNGSIPFFDANPLLTHFFTCRSNIGRATIKRQRLCIIYSLSDNGLHILEESSLSQGQYEWHIQDLWKNVSGL